MVSSAIDYMSVDDGEEVAVGDVPPPSPTESVARPSVHDPQPIVTIVVPVNTTAGESAKTVTFCIHKDIICYYSPYFARVFGGQSVEEETKCMILENTNEYIFSIFTNWLYNQTIQTKSGMGVKNISALAKLWILAQYCVIPKLQNQVMHLLHALVQSTNGPYYLKIFGDLIVQSSNDILMSLLVDKMAVMSSQPCFEKLTAQLQPAELRDLAHLMKIHQLRGIMELRPVEVYLVEEEEAEEAAAN